MSTVVIALVCFAVAFISGSMLSKAFFVTRGSVDRNKLHALLQAQRARYRKRLIALNNVIGLHETTRDQIRDKLMNIERNHADQGTMLDQVKVKLGQEQQTNQALQKQLSEHIRRSDELTADESVTSAMEKKLTLLRIERDELAARIARTEMEHAQNVNMADTNNDRDELARMRADMGEIRETLATRDRNVHDLKVALQETTEQEKLLKDKLDSWKQRVTPLTKKLRQQKEVIQKFCQSDDVEDQGEKPDDDLKAIRGIGPALERRLQQHGIYRYQQLAEMTMEELADIARKLAIAPQLAERDAWIQQARDLQEQAELFQTA